MTSASAVPSPPPGPLSQVERVVDTFVAPSKTFTDLRRSANWLVPLLLTILATEALVFVADRKVGHPVRMRRRAMVAAGALIVGAAACGRKGPPLPPLRPLPQRVADLTARRADGRIVLRFTIPSGNADNSTPPAIGRVDVYARSVPGGSPKPVPEQIVMHPALVGSIDVRPPAAPSEESAGSSPAAGAPARVEPAPSTDTRPAPGDVAVFVDPDPDAVPAALPPIRGRGRAAGGALVLGAGRAAGSAPGGPPSASASPPSSASGSPPASASPPASSSATPPASASTSSPPASTAATSSANAAGAGRGAAPQAPPAKAPPAPPTRYFMVVGISRHGQLGQPSDLVGVPLVPPPPPVHALVLDYDEKTLSASWQAGAPSEQFVVYEVDATGHETTGRPLSPPVKEAAFHEPVVFGKARCLAVRGADVTGSATVESDATFACTTPVDHFPPPVPSGLAGFSDGGAVTLRWDPVEAADLAGYLVLRGEGTDGTLQQLTPSPIVDTTYRDATGRAGATYTYTVVAVDTATPPNRSAAATPVTVTVR